MTPWEIDADEVANCNCDFGCPCQFYSLPTQGKCEAAVGFIVRKGFYGDTRLDGVKFGFTAAWPGAIHFGNGVKQHVIDESATPAQRKAIDAILMGADTEDMATVFWVYSKMSSRQLDTVYAPIDAAIDMEKRTGHIRVPGMFEMDVHPIRNVVTGAEVRARINLPRGIEFRQAEVASGSTRTSGAIRLAKVIDTHAHFCRVYMNGQGVIAHTV